MPKLSDLKTFLFSEQLNLAIFRGTREHKTTDFGIGNPKKKKDSKRNK